MTYSLPQSALLASQKVGLGVRKGMAIVRYMLTFAGALAAIGLAGGLLPLSGNAVAIAIVAIAGYLLVTLRRDEVTRLLDVES